MLGIIKFTGIIILLLSCVLTGLYKGMSIKQRPIKLQKLIFALEALYEQINYGDIELPRALKTVIGKSSFLKVKEGTVYCDDRDLTEEERKLINDFFANLGRNGKQAECGRIAAFKEILTKRQYAAQQEAAKKSQLWQTGGICVGIAVAIMMI